MSVVGPVFSEVLSRDDLLLGHEEAKVGMGGCEVDLCSIDNLLTPLLVQ